MPKKGKKVLCNFYRNVKDIDLKNEGYEKTFTCGCPHHRGDKIRVRVYLHTIREVRESI
jgi:hypothetical protein